MRTTQWIATVIVSLLICSWGIIPASAQNSGFPEKPVELICPYGAGGSTSMGSRIIAGGMGENLGKPVVVINKTGAGGTIGAEFVASAAPDGYTLFVFNSGSNGVAVATRKLRYDNTKFDLFGQYAIQAMGLVVRADAPWKDINELIEGVKKHPDTYTYGTTGIGTSGNFGMELFMMEAGALKLKHVPFKSGPEVITALLGGHIDMSFFYMVDFKGPVEAGRLKLLAIAGEERLKDFPNVPTFLEAGYPKILMYAWYGIAGPKGMPKEVYDKIAKAFVMTVENKDIQGMLAKIGYIPKFRNADEFRQFVTAEDAKCARIAKQANIKIE
jgi:tripartite-type tricarboxylate transporter receptor subunit TctC